MKKIRNFLLSIVLVISAVAGLELPQHISAQEDQTYTIAIDGTFAPFSYIGTDGDYTGIDIDILRAIAEDQGLNIEIQQMTFSAGLQALETSQVDGMIAGMAITDERREAFDFSDPYYVSGNMFAVQPESDIQSYEDLAGETVAVKTGTTGERIASEMADEYGFDITIFEDSANMYEDVMVGNAAATVEVFAVMAHAINTGQVNLRFIGEEISPSEFGFAVPLGENPELLEAFNTGLENIQASGEYDEIIDSYLGSGQEDYAVADTGFLGLLSQNAGALANGLWTTIWVSVVSILIATVLGVIAGLMRVSESALSRGIALVYIDLMRGIPMIVFTFFVYFGVAQWFNVSFTPEVAGVIALSINTGAYIAEIVRGGIQSVPIGQTEASRSLGLTSGKTMRHIVMPQAIRIMTPSFINQFVMTLKNTSILSVIGLVELTQTGRIIISRTYQSGNIWLTIGVMYIILITILTKFSNYLDRRIQSNG